MLRVVLVLIAVSLAVILAQWLPSTPAASGGVSTELSYFPAQTALVATIATDPHGAAVENVSALLGAFPLAKLGIDAVESSLASRRDSITRARSSPCSGNPIVVGALNLQSPSTSFLAVWITRSAAKLTALVKGLPGVTADGSLDGATVYRSGSMTVALDGATAVLGASSAQVGAALSRHAHGGGMSSADFSRGTASLPQDALVRAFGNATTMLAAARTVPWVGAIRGYAVSLSAATTGLVAQFRIDTSARSLTSTQLPIVPGAGPPELAGTLPIALGLRDPAQTIPFIEALDPSAVQPKLAQSLNALAPLLTGNLIVESDTRTTMGRAQVSDPGLAARRLARIPGIVRAPGGFYAFRPGRGKSLDLGLVGNQLVAGAAAPSQLRAFAAAPATPAPNAPGALTFRISVLELLRLALPSVVGQLGIAQAFLSTVGPVTGSASATPQALTGRLALPVR